MKNSTIILNDHIMSQPMQSLMWHTETTHQFIPNFFIGKAVRPLQAIRKFHRNIMFLYETHSKNNIHKKSHHEFRLKFPDVPIQTKKITNKQKGFQWQVPYQAVT